MLKQNYKAGIFICVLAIISYVSIISILFLGASNHLGNLCIAAFVLDVLLFGVFNEPKFHEEKSNLSIFLVLLLVTPILPYAEDRLVGSVSIAVFAIVLLLIVIIRYLIPNIKEQRKVAE